MGLERGLLMMAVLAAAAAAASPDEPARASRGRQILDGEVAITARIAGQDFALPAQASRCINCHGTTRDGAASSVSSAQRIGPALTPALLNRPVRRRGGPPSHYDEASLCRLLSTGIDPAHVIIQRKMPRYEIDDFDCRSLWLHLNARTAP
jgi:hypothetical protein